MPIKDQLLLTNIPHNSNSKRSIMVSKVPDDPTRVRVIVKGAPETLIQKCTKTFNTENKVQLLSNEEMNYVVTSILDRQLASKGYRCILFAVKEMSLEAYERLNKDWNGFKTEEERDILVNDLTFVSLFALEDPVRENVEASIMFADIGRINVRMVSGDSVSTARAIGLQSGILTEQESKHKLSVLHSDEFRRLGGELKWDIDDEGNDF